MSEEEEHHGFRDDVIDDLHSRLHNVIKHYLKQHDDMTNEEMDAVLNRIITYHRQQEIHLYAQYVWDLKKEEERLNKLKGKKLDHFK